MAQSLTLKIKGLYTSVNELSEAPEGALLVADNIDIVKDSVAEPRRGFERLTGGYTTTTDRTAKSWFYQDKQFAHHGPLGSETTVSFLDAGVWTSVGSFSAPTGFRIMPLLAAQNLYFTSSAGIRKLDAYDGTVQLAGAYKALDLEASLSSAAGSALEDDKAVAFRVVWGYRDANNTAITGAPSQREVITNATGSTKDVDLTITIPSGVTTAWFFQVYRSAAVLSSVEPSDELGLVYEGNPTAGDITAGTVSVTDITPDALRGATIYTASSQQGLAAGNERPPLAKDMAVFRGVTFYANTVSKHRYYLTLLAVGGASGVAVDDTVTVDGVTYTAKTAETVASAQFRAYLSGSFDFVDADVSVAGDTITETAHVLQTDDPVTLTTTGALPTGLATDTTYYVVSPTADTFQLAATPGGTAIDITAAAGGGTHTATYGGSASQNIRDTALSLVRVINRHSSSTVYAYYLSGPDDLPGQILLEERSIGGSSFAVTSSNATCWNPTLPSSGTAESSLNDTYENGLWWSKDGQPEAVPLANFVQVGSRDAAILRLVPLKDALYIFKEDGIYRLTGYYPSFDVDLLDSSAKLVAPESCAVLNNQIFCLTDQGVTVVSDGVKILSRSIEQDLLALFRADLDLVKSTSFGIGYETERKYCLFMVGSAGDTYPTQAFVYNVFTNTWVRHVLSATTGVVHDNRLYLGDATSHYVLRDRKSGTYLDYADFGSSTTISAADGTLITIAAGSDTVAEGDILYESTTKFSIITAVDSIASTVTVQTNPGFTVGGDVDLLHAIDCDVKWVPVTTGNPGITKQYHSVALLFKSDFNGTGYLTFSTDLSVYEESVPVSGAGIGSWGLSAWGSAPWGGASRKRPSRQWVPRNKQRCTQLTVSFQHAYGFSFWQLQGLTVFGTPGSDRTTR